MYNKPINHFIFNTGSSYLYIESNGYEYSVNETTGEDTMYMKLPRCIIEITDINIPTEELTSAYARGYYERKNGNMICGYNAEIQRIPLEITVNAKYYLANFNESIVLLQELIDTMVFQRYFKISYLGQIIQCSIEFPANANPELNKIDMTSPDPTQKNITLDFKISTNYPNINVRSEIPTDKVIAVFGSNIVIHDDINDKIDYWKSERDRKSDETVTDVDKHGRILGDQSDGYEGLILNTYKDHSQDVIDHDDENNIEELIDVNKDGKFDKNDIEKILDSIKYDHYIEDADIDNNFRINWNDLNEMIKLINGRKDVKVEYDPMTHYLYLHHTDTNETEEIDLYKYKIE
jgi:hypothetical protein